MRRFAPLLRHRHRFALALAVGLAAAPVALVPARAEAQGVSIDQATDAQKKDAQGHYDRGANAFDAKKYEEAFAGFAASYGIVRSPNAHMMMARALLALGKNARAYNELVVAEQEAAGNARYAQTLERTKELRTEAAQKVGVVNIKLVGEKTVALRVTVNGILAPVELPYAVEPGKVTIKAMAGDSAVDTKEIDLPAGKTEEVSLRVGEDFKPKPKAPVQFVPPPPGAPPPPPPKEQKPRPGAATPLLIGGTAVGLLGLGGLAIGAGFYFAAKDTLDYLESPEDSGCVKQGDGYVCPEGAQARIDAGEDNQKAAAIAAGVGGGLTAIGMAMAIAGGALIPNDDAGDARRAPLRVGVGPGSVWFGGEF